MSKLSNILRKFEGDDVLVKCVIERCEFLDKENTLMRSENLRLRAIVKELINVLAEKTFKKGVEAKK